MESFTEAKAVRTYLHLMHELAIRLDLVAAACKGKLNLTPPYAREYCYLQFRRICELVALGCLQLHGDLAAAQSNAAKKEWHAERIMRLLQRNHPHAFPQSLIRTKTADGWSLQANSKPNALTYPEFTTLYSKCGEVLHRGTIRTIESAAPIGRSDYDEVIKWTRKLVDLLNEHLVARSDAKGLYHVSLRTDSGGPACSVFTGFSQGAVKVATYDLNVREGGKVSNPSTTTRRTKLRSRLRCRRFMKSIFLRVWRGMAYNTGNTDAQQS
jgi:hypothetical protein